MLGLVAQLGLRQTPQAAVVQLVTLIALGAVGLVWLWWVWWTQYPCSCGKTPSTCECKR